MRDDHFAGRISDWLSLAAAPAFAIMALLTSASGFGGPPDIHGSPLAGMVPMYALMSAFHSAPWLTLISRRNSLGAGTAARREGSA